MQEENNFGFSLTPSCLQSLSRGSLGFPHDRGLVARVSSSMVMYLNWIDFF